MSELKPLPNAGDYISSVRWDEESGFRVISAKVTSITITTKGTKIRAPKAFYPIDCNEYDFAPNKEYPLALADFYYGENPLTVDEVKRMIDEVRNRRAGEGEKG